MLTQNQMEILSCFFPKLENLAAKDIENKSGFSHETTFRLLKELVKMKHLMEKKIGKTNVYKFIKNDFTYQVFIYYATKRKISFKEKHLLLYMRVLEFIKEIGVDDIVIIFGSYAKETQTRNSDIDLLCVTNKKNLKKIAETFKTKYNLNLQLVQVKPTDFKNIKKDNIIFWNDLIKYGIVLDGLEHFFKEVYVYD